jgi:sugar lactone lactonase YvrE
VSCYKTLLEKFVQITTASLLLTMLLVMVTYADSVDYVATLGLTNTASTSNVHFNAPNGIAMDTNGLVYVADTSNNRVQIFNSNYNYVATIGNGFAGNSNNQFTNPMDVAVDASGIIYVADSYNHRIQIFDAYHNYIGTLGTGVMGVANDQFSLPLGLAIGPNGNLYVADTQNHRIQIFDLSRNYVATIGTGSHGNANNQLNSPTGVAVQANGNIFVVDSSNHRIQIFDASRNFLRTLGAGISGGTNDQFDNPHDITFDSSGNIYVSDRDNHRVQVFSGDFNYIGTIGTGMPGNGNSELYTPSGVHMDGNNDLYVADMFNHRIQIFEGIALQPQSNGCFIAAPTSVQEGREFIATIRCNDVNEFYGFQFGVSLTGSGWVISEGFALGEFAMNSVNPVLTASNTLELFAQTHTGDDISNGSFTLGTFAIEADKFLTDDGIILLTLDNFLASDRNGNILNLVQSTPNTFVRVQDVVLTQINGTVSLQSDGTVFNVAGAYLTLDGIVHGPLESAGRIISIGVGQEGNSMNIAVTASMLGHLNCTTSVIVPDGISDITSMIGTLTLKAGDVTDVGGVGIINIQDAVALGARFGSNLPGEEDINQDGIVDILDLIHVGRNYTAVAGECSS